MELYLVINELDNEIYIVANTIEEAIQNYHRWFKQLRIKEIKFISKDVFVGE